MRDVGDVSLYIFSVRRLYISNQAIKRDIVLL